MGAKLDNGGPGAHDPWTVHHQPLGRARDDGDAAHRRMGHPRSAQRVDEQVEFELVLDERLDPSAGTTESTVPQPDLDDIARPEIPIDSMNEQRLLKWPLATLHVVE